MKRIDANARTIRALLDGAKFSIDSYQREYAWKERQIQELINDLTGKFLDSYDPDHSRHEIAKYDPYFLGSIVISNKQDKRFIVDGQQRLTSLTLLLIFLHHRQKKEANPTPILNLIFSMRFGQKSFNLDVPEREDMLRSLLDAVPAKLNGASEPVRNLADRYQTIVDYFPEEIDGPAVVYFVDWLLENVHLVEIEAFSDEEAYTIFETMNDRGLPLSLPEMLKGYVLAKITFEGDQRAVNALWKSRMQELKTLGGEEDSEDIDFFKNWLRARHAETIRPGKKGAENKDYERIGTEFHRWVREANGALNLKTSDDFVRFVKRDLDFYASQTLAIRKAAKKLTEGWESIRYNEDRGFTLQTQVILAALTPHDPEETTRRKVAMVADFLRHLAGTPRLEFPHDQLFVGQVHRFHPHQGTPRSESGGAVGIPAGATGRAARAFRHAATVPPAPAELPAGPSRAGAGHALGRYQVRTALAFRRPHFPGPRPALRDRAHLGEPLRGVRYALQAPERLRGSAEPPRWPVAAPAWPEPKPRRCHL